MKKVNNIEGGRPLKTSDLQLTNTYDTVIATLAEGVRVRAGSVDGDNGVLILEGCTITEGGSGHNISAGHVSVKGVAGMVHIPAQQGVTLPWRFNVSSDASDYRKFYNGELLPSVTQQVATAADSGSVWLSLDTPRAESAIAPSAVTKVGYSTSSAYGVPLSASGITDVISSSLSQEVTAAIFDTWEDVVREGKMARVKIAMCITGGDISGVTHYPAIEFVNVISTYAFGELRQVITPPSSSGLSRVDLTLSLDVRRGLLQTTATITADRTVRILGVTVERL
ncbi:MAG: hypothetical protein SNG97_06740 [Rikenellaceae bacterium]